MSIRYWSWAAALLAAALMPSPLQAQVPLEPARAGVSVTAGAMRPVAASVRELYPGTFVPVMIEAGVRLNRNLFMFGSGQFVSKAGEVVLNLPPVPEDRFPLKLRMSSVRAGAGAAFPWRRWVFLAAGGVSFTSYVEEWTGEDIPDVSGSSVGFLVQGGVEYRVSRRFSAVWRVEYSHTPLDAKTDASADFNLSGLAVTGGVGFRF